MDDVFFINVTIGDVLIQTIYFLVTGEIMRWIWLLRDDIGVSVNVSFLRLKGVILELRGIRHQLERLADCWEMELSNSGINMRPPKADTSGPDPTVSYVDEEMDYARETIEHLKRADTLLDQEEG